METFTEPRPEALEMEGAAAEERGEVGLQDGWSTVGWAQEPIFQGSSGSPCSSSGLSSPTHCPPLKSHPLCSQASHALGGQSVGHYSKPVNPQKTRSETDGTVEVVGSWQVLTWPVARPSMPRPLYLLYHTHKRPPTPPVGHTIESHTFMPHLCRTCEPCCKDLRMWLGRLCKSIVTMWEGFGKPSRGLWEMSWAVPTLFPPSKQCWVCEGVTLAILKGYLQSGGHEPLQEHSILRR